MRELGPTHGCDYSDYLENYVYIPAHDIAKAKELYKEEGELMMYTDEDAFDAATDEIVSFKTWLERNKEAIGKDTLIVNAVGVDRLLGWPLRVSRTLTSTNADPSHHRLLQAEVELDAGILQYLPLQRHQKQSEFYPRSV